MNRRILICLATLLIPALSHAQDAGTSLVTKMLPSRQSHRDVGPRTGLYDASPRQFPFTIAYGAYQNMSKP